jgi:hypothetical protein
VTHFVVHPWRERLRTGLLVVAVAVPVGIVIGGGLDLGGSDDGAVDAGGSEAAAADASSSTTTSTTPATTTTPPTTTTVVPGRAPAEVRVRFYNGSRTAGAAVTVAQRLRPLGYALLPPGPSPADPIPATVVAFREGNGAEAAAVARALGLEGVAPTPMPPTPNVAGIGNADVVVIVGDELVALASQP